MRKERRSGSWRERSARLLARVFPERQFMLRTDGHVTYILLSRRIQVGIFCLLSLIGGWTAFGSVSYVFHGEILAAKDDQIANAKLAYRSLLSEVVEYQNKFSTIARDLEENHDMMLALVEKNTTLQQNLQTVRSRLKTTEKERTEVVAARETLKEKLTGIEDRMRSMANHNFSLKGSLDTIESDLQTAMAERNRAQFEGVQTRRQMKKLETRLADLQNNEMDVVQRLTRNTIDPASKVCITTIQRLYSMLKGEGVLLIHYRPESSISVGKRQRQIFVPMYRYAPYKPPFICL